jgi:hypothetical protein
VAIGAENKYLPAATHAGVHHYHMNGAPWKKGVGGSYAEGGFLQSLTADAVCQVNDAGCGGMGKYDPLHDSDIFVIKSEIRGQSDYIVYLTLMLFCFLLRRHPYWIPEINKEKQEVNLRIKYFDYELAYGKRM